MVNATGENEMALAVAKEEDEPLSPRYRKFVDVYLSNKYNAKQAAIAVGFPEGSAGSRGHEIVNKREVREAIDAHLEAAGATRDAVLASIMESAYNTDVAEFEPFIRGRKTLAELRESGVDTRKVKSVSMKTTGITIHLHDSSADRERLAKIVGLYDGHQAAGATNVNLTQNNVVVTPDMSDGERNVRLFLAGKHKSTLPDVIEGECTPLLPTETTPAAP